MIDAEKMDLDDVVTMPNGDLFSDTWYYATYKKLFRPRRCDRCKETKDCMGAMTAGTMRFANNAIFGYRVEAAERIMRALDLKSYCEPCMMKLRYNGSPPPLTWSQEKERRRLAKETADAKPN
jgi:hypothetical protein